MPDEKPTLDYGRPDPPRGGPTIDMATSLLLAIVTFAIAMTIFWGSSVDEMLFNPVVLASILLLTLISIWLFMGSFHTSK